jgi:hypothetical protein
MIGSVDWKGLCPSGTPGQGQSYCIVGSHTGGLHCMTEMHSKMDTQSTLCVKIGCAYITTKRHVNNIAVKEGSGKWHVMRHIEFIFLLLGVG